MNPLVRPLFCLAAVLMAGCNVRASQIHACLLQADARHPFHLKTTPDNAPISVANLNDFREVENQIILCMQDAGYTLVVNPQTCPLDSIRNIDDLGDNCFVLAGGGGFRQWLHRMMSTMS